VTRSDHGLLAIFFDLGDTIMVEESEVKDAEGTTLEAALIPDVAALLHDLHAHGLPLALVADSRPNTPPNVLRQHELLDLFEAVAISEVVGSTKPDPGIFRVALESLSIPEGAHDRVAMVGNNLERDIVGANRLGLISIFFQWNERRRTEPLTADEIPDFTVHTVEDLRNVLFSIDRLVGPLLPPDAQPSYSLKEDT
jgi:HAD superfamily hydrolase (TIGR01549 family)